MAVKLVGEWSVFFLLTNHFSYPYINIEGAVACMLEEDLNIQLEEWEGEKPDATVISPVENSLLFESKIEMKYVKNMFVLHIIIIL